MKGPSHYVTVQKESWVINASQRESGPHLMIHYFLDTCLDQQLGTLIAGKQRHIDALQQMQTRNTWITVASKVLSC